MLRASSRGHWLRIHSLPGSKRYPDDPPEREELLRRHNEMATEIIGAGEKATLFLQCYPGEDELPANAEKFDWARTLKFLSAEQAQFFRDQDMPDFLISAVPIQWTPGSLDELLLDVAEERVCSVTFLNERSGELYSPYDGGADLFLASKNRVDVLKKRWRTWLSEHQDGL